MKKLVSGLFAIGLLALAGTASAGGLYSNGPLNGEGDGFTFNFGYAVSDSFTLTGTATVTGFDFGAWTDTGATITAVDWSIGTTVGASDEGSGTAAPVTDVFQFNNDFEDDVNMDTVSGISVTLGAGTYYLTLQNAVTSDGEPAYWDENDGPSAGYQSTSAPTIITPDSNDFTNLQNNDLANDQTTCANGQVTCTGSETFDINPSSTTPEPGSLMLFGSGMLLLAGGLRRKLSK